MQFFTSLGDNELPRLVDKDMQNWNERVPVTKQQHYRGLIPIFFFFSVIIATVLYCFMKFLCQYDLIIMHI